MPLGVGYAVHRGVCCLSEPNTRRAQVQGSLVASPLIPDQMLLVTYSPQGKPSQRAGDPASYPSSA